ncbi:MAG: hypothetical protein LBT50_07525 [Prevotellaceae bacterium]|nr:hypothetical protein [Prevotellaceae bacterium]
MASVFFLSCDEEAKIQVTSKVHNVRLDNISYSNVRIGTYLLPGETVEATITDRYRDISFPLSAQLEFYMAKGDKRVYLKTKEYFKVNKDETLKITIADDTELINPMD